MKIPFKADYCKEPIRGCLALRCSVTTLNKALKFPLPTQGDMMNAARTAGNELVARLKAVGIEIEKLPAPDVKDLPYGGTCYEQVVILKRDAWNNPSLDGVLRGKRAIIEIEA